MSNPTDEVSPESTSAMWDDPAHPADPLRDLRDAYRTNPDPWLKLQIEAMEAQVNVEKKGT